MSKGSANNGRKSRDSPNNDCERDVSSGAPWIVVDSGQYLFYHGKPSEVLEHIADHNGAYLQRGDHLNGANDLQFPSQAFPATFCPQATRAVDGLCDAFDFFRDLRT